MALQEQEINTRDSLKRKEFEKETRNEQYLPIMSKECQNTISHHYRLPCCLFEPLLEYPPQCHSGNHIQKHYKRQRKYNEKIFKDPEPITVFRDLEIWWDKPVLLPRKIPHNRPDIIISDKKTLSCTIIDVSVPLDLDIEKKNQDKRNDYMLYNIWGTTTAILNIQVHNRYNRSLWHRHQRT